MAQSKASRCSQCGSAVNCRETRPHRCVCGNCARLGRPARAADVHLTGDGACPACGKLMGLAVALRPDGLPARGVIPRPGQPVLCSRCGHLMIYNEALVAREPTAAELLTLQANEAMWAAITAASRRFASSTGH